MSYGPAAVKSIVAQSRCVMFKTVRPNLFVVGAPKCGTTSLYEYLRTHPRVFLPELKELHYLDSDFPNYGYIKDHEEYFGLFSKAEEQHEIIGEASVFYMYSQVAASNISSIGSNVRIIIMLRNPVDMVQSMHSQLCFSFFEDEPDFWKAWCLQEKRSGGQCIPRECSTPEFLQYRKLAAFPGQVRRYFDVFGRDRVKVFLLDDLKKSPRGMYQEAVRFLGLPDDGKSEFPVVNANRRNRFEWIGKLARHPPFPLNHVKRRLKLAGIKDTKAMAKFLEWNTKPESRAPISVEQREHLQCCFRDEVSELGELIQRDLGHWNTASR